MLEIIKIGVNSNFIFFFFFINMNDVHDVQCLRNFFGVSYIYISQNSRFITDITALKTSLVNFERLSRKRIRKNQREMIFVIASLFSSSCSSWLSSQNSGQLNFFDRIENSFTTCIFAYSPLFYLSLHQYFLFFYFFYKNIISRSPFFTWLFSTFLSTNFLKFIVKKDWMNR